jgi:hypothetical protein
VPRSDGSEALLTGIYTNTVAVIEPGLSHVRKVIVRGGRL